MNTTLRQALRDTIAQQSDAPPPAGLAEKVIGRYRRRRTTRAASAGVAAVMAAAVAVPVVLHDPGTGEPTAAEWTGNRVVITSLSGEVRPSKDPKVRMEFISLLLNLKTGEYDELPPVYLGVVPSPDGKMAVVGTEVPRSRVGVLDRADGQVRWLDVPANLTSRMASWAPDSTRFVLTHGDEEAVVVDARTLATTRVVPVPTMLLPMVGSFVWSPSGDRLLAPDGGTVPGAMRFTHINEYDLAGRLQRALPVQVRLDSTAQFSPDGRRIALLDFGEPAFDPPKQGPPKIRIVDAATGAEEPRVVQLAAGTYNLVGWYDAEHLVVAMKNWQTATGANATLNVVRIADGRVVRTVELPGGHAFNNIQLTPVAGLPEAARKHAF